MKYQSQQRGPTQFCLCCLVVLSGILVAGCNSDPGCQRETALLRAEILDLEDKYYSLKSRREFDAREVLLESGEVLDEGAYLVSKSSDSYGTEIIYDEGQVIYENGPVIHGPLEVEHEIFPSGRNTRPTVRNREILPRTIETDTENFESILPDDELPSILSEPDANRAIDVLPMSPNDFNDQSQNLLDSSTIELSLDEPLEIAPRAARNVKATFRAEKLVINRRASSGENVDGQPGDDGLALLIQPENANGEIGLATGRLTVNLIDPSASAAEKVVGHWNFLPEETELFFAEDHKAGKGILLHLPWEQNTPSADMLIVSVQMKTSDGRTMETTSEVRIDPPPANYSPDSPLVAGWTKRDSRWAIDRGEATGGNPQMVSRPGRWRESRTGNPRRANTNRQQIAEQQTDRYDRTNPERAIGKPRLKAIPASSANNITKPGWRPTR